VGRRAGDVVEALSRDGFEECQRETTSRQNLQPAGGVWQGVNPGTGSVAFSSLERDPYTDDGGES
jgi:hypothetical protein